MGLIKAIIATTNVDSHGDQFTKNALQGMVNQLNEKYVRVIKEHDPRKIPIGRIINSSLIELENGHFGVETISEIFDGNSEIEDDKNRFLAIENDILSENINITYDFSYLDKVLILEELNQKILKNEKLHFQTKKSIEPLSILTIAGVYICGKIFEGFLNKIGEDFYEIFKEKLFQTLETQKNKNERVLEFSLDLKKDSDTYRVNIYLTNPTKNDISNVIDLGFRKLDQEIHKYLSPQIKEIDINYNNNKFEISYMLNGQAKVLLPKDEFRIIDFYV